MLKKKLTSRKFLSALISIITGLLLIFGVDENTTALITGAIMVVGPAIIYILTEGKIDAAAVAGQVDFDALMVLLREYTAAREAAAFKAGDRKEGLNGGTI